jgi:hypothetical protein
MVQNSSSSTNQGRLVTPWKPEPGEDDEDKKVEGKLTDSAKLKGVLWPGMDLFDSATPEMKRMRNQRKDSNVLEQMMATSAGVERAEVSYHANGEFRGSRDIFGPLSAESSPVRIFWCPDLISFFVSFGLEIGIENFFRMLTLKQIREKVPSPKKRKTRKATLADISVNAPRAQAPRSRAPRLKKPVPTASPIKRSPSSIQDHTITSSLFLKPTPTLNPLAGFGRRFAPSADEDEEFRLAVEDMGGKKRSFNIFQDAPEDSPGTTVATPFAFNY